MGSKIAPTGWMREIAVSDLFSPPVPGPSRTRLLALPKVGRDGEERRGPCLPLREIKSLNHKRLFSLPSGFSLLWKRSSTSSSCAQCSLPSRTPKYPCTKSSGQPERAPCPCYPKPCLPTTLPCQPTSALAYSPLCCQSTVSPPPCLPGLLQNPILVGRPIQAQTRHLIHWLLLFNIHPPAPPAPFLSSCLPAGQPPARSCAWGCSFSGAGLSTSLC